MWEAIKKKISDLTHKSQTTKPAGDSDGSAAAGTKAPLKSGSTNFAPRFTYWFLFLTIWLWLWQGVFGAGRATSIPYSEFKKHLALGEVLEVELTDGEIRGSLAPNGIALHTPPELGGEAWYTPFLPPGWTDRSVAVPGGTAANQKVVLFRAVRVEDSNLIQELSAAGVRFSGSRPSALSQFLWSWVLPVIFMFGLWSWMARRFSPGSSLLGMGKSRAKVLVDKTTGVSFDDVAGCDEAKHELVEVVDFLKSPDRYKALGATVPKGVLLVGPPGTGKTLLARAVAGEAGVPFFSMAGSDFVEMIVGVGAARVRDLFVQAKQQAPCIVFIDEVDAIGRHRSVHSGVGNDEREQTLNQLLTEMDGFEPNAGVIILAATNRPEVLDRALLRPGRFDRQVVIDAPDRSGRVAVLKVHSRNKPLDNDVDLEKIAQATPGFSGADLANTVNEAALLATRRAHTTISQADLSDAIEKVIAGPERRSRRLGDEEKRRVAYHEAGHALVAASCKKADPVQKISIVPRGKAALGYTLQLPDGESFLQTRAELTDRLRSLLGGRAAEELVFTDVSTGAENDLEKATAIAEQMVCNYGMGRRVGLTHVAERRPLYVIEGSGQPAAKNCSPATARIIDEEVREELKRAYDDAKEILEKRRADLDALAAELIRRETLEGPELRAFLKQDEDRERIIS